MIELTKQIEICLFDLQFVEDLFEHLQGDDAFGLLGGCAEVNIQFVDYDVVVDVGEIRD
jgi:hypothetical protein